MKWQIGQSKSDHTGVDKSSYICWYVKEFLNVGCSVRPMTVPATGLSAGGKNDSFERYVFCTRSSKLWNDLESKWYVSRIDHKRFKRRKIVPQDIKLTPLTLCIWHMDDGSNYAKDANITLETQGFTPEEVNFLIERLDQDLGINGKKKKAKKPDQFRIYVGRKSYFDYIEMIKPHMAWDCFRYKVDTSGYHKCEHRREGHSLAKLTEEKVREIKRLLGEGVMQKEVAAKMSVKQATISLIKTGRRWAHVT